MEKMRNITELTAIIMEQVQILQNLKDEMEMAGLRIMKMTGKSGGIRQESEIPEDISAALSHNESAGVDVYREKAAGNAYSLPSQMNCRSFEGAAEGPSNIIPFPGPGMFTTHSARAEPCGFRRERVPILTPFMAVPGRTLPAEIPDYRPLLQRDGLILLAWDKRLTETGERYTAYWVTSTGVPRFYASRPHSQDDFYSAQPDHKSYAAEDGIEFYGQEAPVYIVHVAPELMMSNPPHGELRQAHIKTLKSLGSDVDFDYKYLLTAEKKRNLPLKKPTDNTKQADA